RMGEPLPTRVVGAAWWNGGRSVAGCCELRNGSRWDSAWIQLLATREYRESIQLFFDTTIRSLTFPSPWLRMSPTVYERQDADGSFAAIASSAVAPRRPPDAKSSA